MRTTPTCPFFDSAPEDEAHIFWHCTAWHTARTHPAQEVEEHRLHHALQGNLQTGLALSCEQVVSAKRGGSCSSFGADFFPIIEDGKLPQRPYTGTLRHTTTHRAPQPVPLPGQAQCSAHSATACMTCKRLRRIAEECCKLGHHADEHVARRPQLQLCPLRSLPPCARYTLKQRGVCHCCQRGHHKLCSPVPAHRKRALSAQSLQPHKNPCLQRPTRHTAGLLRSPHKPVTPPAPKRRRPKTPPPRSPQCLSPRGWRRPQPRTSPARFF